MYISLLFPSRNREFLVLPFGKGLLFCQVARTHGIGGATYSFVVALWFHES